MRKAAAPNVPSRLDADPRWRFPPPPVPLPRKPPLPRLLAHAKSVTRPQQHQGTMIIMIAVKSPLPLLPQSYRITYPGASQSRRQNPAVLELFINHSAAAAAAATALLRPPRPSSSSSSPCSRPQHHGLVLPVRHRLPEKDLRRVTTCRLERNTLGAAVWSSVGWSVSWSVELQWGPVTHTHTHTRKALSWEIYNYIDNDINLNRLNQLLLS
ncbi:hypothetical protein Vafri_454 [Volvox africanus]|nr:hypothetical protein Vafri_454 [Volvox africanus]